MRWLLTPLLATFVGCQSNPVDVAQNVEAQVTAVVPARVVADVVSGSQTPAGGILPADANDNIGRRGRE